MATAAERKRKSRALQPKAKREDERAANRERNRRKRVAGRPRPVTNQDFLKEAARFGPAEDGPKSKPQILGGQPVANGGLVPRAAERGQLGKGWDYNRANIGPPRWWLDAEEAWRADDRMIWHAIKPSYSNDERRWVRYFYGFAQRKDNTDVGQRLERRGLEVATQLGQESRDVQWVANWLRDGWNKVPPRIAKRFSDERVQVAMRRLQALGMLIQRGRWLIV